MSNDKLSELFAIWKAFDGGGSFHLIAGVDKAKPDFKARLKIGTDIEEVWLYEKGRKRLFFNSGMFR